MTMQFITSNEDYNIGAKDMHRVCLRKAGLLGEWEYRFVNEDAHWELVNWIVDGNKIELDLHANEKVHKKYVKGAEDYCDYLEESIVRIRKIRQKREKHLVDFSIKRTFE